MHVSSLPFTAKSVVDADNEPLGEVVGSELTGETREPRSLLISPSPELAELVDDAGLWLDVDQVSSIRRGSCQVDVSLAELLEAGEP